MLAPSGLKSVFEVDNTHPLFKGTEYENQDFMLTIDVNDWYFKSTLRASLRAERELGTPPPLEDGEVEDITGAAGMHRHLYNRTVSYYAISKYKFVTTIKEWSGFVDENGEELDCTEANILKFVEDIGYQKFFDIIYRIIDEAGKKTPEEKIVDDALGNSSVGFDGTTEAPTAELE